jgi:hypothetical protein
VVPFRPHHLEAVGTYCVIRDRNVSTSHDEDDLLHTWDNKNLHFVGGLVLVLCHAAAG